MQCLNTRKFRNSEKLLFYSGRLGRQEKKDRNLERQHFKKSENQLNTKRLFQANVTNESFATYCRKTRQEKRKKKRQRKMHIRWKT